MINIVNKTGPRMEPWGNPRSKGSNYEMESSLRTLRILDDI